MELFFGVYKLWFYFLGFKLKRVLNLGLYVYGGCYFVWVYLVIIGLVWVWGRFYREE